MEHGHELSGYQVIATLGYGARSTIFMVRDVKQAKTYALKQVIRKSQADDRFLDQAIREHEIACQFNHPGLRQSYKVMRVRRLLKLAEIHVLMEFVDGVTLEQHRIKTVADVIQLAMQICDALHAMHEGGYVHADIKPTNIIVGSSMDVKLIDFGQSCPIGTIKERIQGTPDYIAPEQVKRMRIIPQTDVFNLGATLYWLLTNQHVPTLIPKHQTKMVLAATSARATPPRDLNPAVPPALSTLIMQCVREDWNDRPATMLRFKERLQYALAQINGESVATASPDSTRSPGQQTAEALKPTHLTE